MTFSKFWGEQYMRAYIIEPVDAAIPIATTLPPPPRMENSMLNRDKH
jgi:hypothetical protein